MEFEGLLSAKVTEEWYWEPYEDHGRMSVTEKALLAVLRPEAEEYIQTIRLEERAAGDDLAKKRAVIERRQQALDARLDVDRVTPDVHKGATRALHQELADLHRDAAGSRTLRPEQVPSWSDVPAMNRHLRRIWTKVQLDPDMRPTAYWRDPRWRCDPEKQLRQEDELRDHRGRGAHRAASHPGRRSRVTIFP